MTDKETVSAEEIRHEKLMAARRKLKKFQSRKTDQVDGGDSEISSHKTSYEESRNDANDMLVSDHDTLSNQRSDEGSTQIEYLNSESQFLQTVSMTSSPPLPPPAAATTQTTLVSLPSSSSPPSSSLGQSSSSQRGTSLSEASENEQLSPLLQQQFQTLQHKKSCSITSLDELQKQHNPATMTKDQQLCEPAEIYSLLVQDYSQMKAQFLEATATCQSQRDKLTDLQASLEAAQQKIAELTTPLSSTQTEQLKNSNQTRKIEKQHISESIQFDHDGDDRAKWEEISALADERQQQIDQLQTSNAIFRAEASRLGGVVNDLEEKLARLQVDSITKNSDISSQTDEDNAISTSIDSIQRLEQQQHHEATKLQLVTTKHQLDDNLKVISDLKEQMEHLERERSTLKQQLFASQKSVSMKDEELETASVGLGHLEQQYTSIKQTLDEKESLYTDLLKTKGDIEQQLQHRQLIVDRLYHINQKADQVLSAHEKVEQKATVLETQMKEQHQHWERKQTEWDDKAVQHDNLSRNYKTQAIELEAARSSLAFAESQTKSHLDKFAEIESRCSEQQLYIRQLEENQQSLEEQRRVLEQQLKTLQSELDERHERADAAEKARSRLHEDHTSLQSQLASSCTHLEEQQALVATLNAQLQTRGDQIGEMDTRINVFEKKMEQLQQTIDDLEQQLVSERDATAAANIKVKQQTEELERMAQNDLLQQERDKRQEEVGSLSSQMDSLQKRLVELQNEAQQHTQRYDDKVAALEASTQKHSDVEQLLEQTRYWWMAEQAKVANMTEDITQLRRQLQHNMNDRQKLQRQLDETKQLLANRDQNTQALQWQVTDMESNAQHQLDLLSRQLKDAHEELAMKSKQAEQLQDRLSVITAAATRATPTIDQQNTNMMTTTTAMAASLSTPAPSPLTKPLPQSPSIVNNTEREQQMENEMKELQQRLERQYEAFATIRDELTMVRDKQLGVEVNASKEKDHLMREQKQLELTINTLRTEYQDHLQRMWAQHQATRHHHEEDLILGRNVLEAAQVKLMQNGLSPVSENGFDWMNEEEDEGHGHGGNYHHPGHDNVTIGVSGGGSSLPSSTDTATKTAATPTPTAIPTTANTSSPPPPSVSTRGSMGSMTTSKSPSLGILPPLEKPAFSEFLETPRCSGCQTEVIDI